MWSVGMVEELKLEKIYAQRGVELITPAVGARIDRLINQKAPNVVAISADWNRARHAGLTGRRPLMFSHLGTTETSAAQTDPEGSILDVLVVTPEIGRGAVIAEHVRRIVATVFDCDVATSTQTTALRHRSGFHDGDGFPVEDQQNVLIDLPISTYSRRQRDSLSDRDSQNSTRSMAIFPAPPKANPLQPAVVVDDVDRLVEGLSAADL